MRPQGVGAVIPRLITAADARFIAAGVVLLHELNRSKFLAAAAPSSRQRRRLQNLVWLLRRRGSIGSNAAHRCPPRRSRRRV